MAMGHVVLKEFFVDREMPRFVDYCKQYTDLPFLVTLTRRGGRRIRARQVPHRRRPRRHVEEGAEFKTVLIDDVTGEPTVPERLAGRPVHRVRQGPLEPRPRRHRPAADPARRGARGASTVDLPRFDNPGGAGGVLRRGVPVREVGGRLVTTVFDLLLAQYGVGRPGLPGELAHRRTTTPSQPYTPAWQEQFTGVPGRRGGEDRPRVRGRTPRSPAAAR